MKKLLIAMAMLVGVSSPALAQTIDAGSYSYPSDQYHIESFHGGLWIVESESSNIVGTVDVDTAEYTLSTRACFANPNAYLNDMYDNTFEVGGVAFDSDTYIIYQWPTNVEGTVIYRRSQLQSEGFNPVAVFNNGEWDVRDGMSLLDVSMIKEDDLRFTWASVHNVWCEIYPHRHGEENFWEEMKGNFFNFFK